MLKWAQISIVTAFQFCLTVSVSRFCRMSFDVNCCIKLKSYSYSPRTNFVEKRLQLLIYLLTYCAERVGRWRHRCAGLGRRSCSWKYYRRRASATVIEVAPTSAAVSDDDENTYADRPLSHCLLWRNRTCLSDPRSSQRKRPPTIEAISECAIAGCRYDVGIDAADKLSVTCSIIEETDETLYHNMMH